MSEGRNGPSNLAYLGRWTGLYRIRDFWVAGVLGLADNLGFLWFSLFQVRPPILTIGRTLVQQMKYMINHHVCSPWQAMPRECVFVWSNIIIMMHMMMY